MASESDWVEDVARWCHGAANPLDTHEGEIELGYEAALPPLLARQWPDAPASMQGELDL